MSFPFRSLPLIGLLLSAACDGSVSRASSKTDDSATMSTGAPPSATAAPSSGMSDFSGMSGMASMSDDAVMPSHLAMLQQASPDSLVAQLPQHRQLVANMLSRMAREMRPMNMPGNALWNSTVDSLPQDLIHMPELTRAQLGTATSPHLRRVTRRPDMHLQMMQSMQP